MKIWLDITNTPQVHFLLAIKSGLEEAGFKNFSISARDFSETINLLRKKTDAPFQVFGDHKGKNISKKAIGLIKRFYDIKNKINDFDASLSCGSEAAIWTSMLKRKLSLAYGDNDLARQWTYGFFVDYAIFPKSIPPRVLYNQGLRRSKLYQYDGFKEHVYIADYEPDVNFKNILPFDEYVVVRPENIQANYVRDESSKSITPELLRLLDAHAVNVLFLPRYPSDKVYGRGLKNIFIPDKPINGLDACYYSNGVFTGAGTFAREAACLGIPSFSFFLGRQLLAVDNDLVKQEKMFFSRNPVELVNKFKKSSKTIPNLTKAKEVKDEVIFRTIDFLHRNGSAD